MLGRRYLSGSNEYFNRGKTGIKTVAAVHGQCLSWVKRYMSFAVGLEAKSAFARKPT
jgi:hypothetical protein